MEVRCLFFYAKSRTCSFIDIKDKILPLKRVCTLCKVKCKKCDNIIQTDKNQLLYCRCGSVGLDGAIGETYARIIGNKEDFEDLCEWEYEHTSISEEDARRFYQKFIKLVRPRANRGTDRRESDRR